MSLFNVRHHRHYRPLHEITWNSKVPRPGEPLIYTNLLILQLMKQRPRRTLLEVLQLVTIKVGIGIWVPCLGFLPILSLFIWARCVHVAGINSRRCRKCSLYGSRKPFQQPSPPSLPIAIKTCVVWDISGSQERHLFCFWSMFRKPYNMGFLNPKEEKAKQIVVSTRCFWNIEDHLKIKE